MTEAATTQFVDTTYLICANSHLFPAKRGSTPKDDGHETAFCSLLTYVCNGGNLHYVRPTKHWEAEIPLMTLLKPEAGLLDIADTESTENQKELSILYSEVADDFSKWLTPKSAQILKRWVEYQLCADKLESVFFEGSLDRQKLNLQEAYSYLAPHFSETRLEKYWTRYAGSIDLQGEHAAQIGQLKGVQTPEEYTLLYGFFGYAKGWLYPNSLNNGNKAAHFVHPIRKHPLRRLTGTVDENDHFRPPLEGLKEYPMFHWGAVLDKIASEKNPEEFTTNLPEAIEHLRSQTNEQAIWEQIIIEGLPDLGKCKTDVGGKITHESYLEELIKSRKKAVARFAFDALEGSPWRMELKENKIRDAIIAALFTAGSAGIAATLFSNPLIIAIVTGGSTLFNLLGKMESIRYARKAKTNVFRECGIFAEFNDSWLKDSVEAYDDAIRKYYEVRMRAIAKT